MPRLALLFIIYHLSFSPAGAQSFRDFAFEQDSSAWLTSDNAAALTRFSMPSISRADVYGQLQRGGFVDYCQSPKSTEAGASVESYYRLSPKTVVYGRMSYDNFAGRDMAGSAFIRSERLPFDIVEDSLTNLGRKHLDSYQLVGAVGVALWRGLSVGVRAEYTSANYAKYKDLRHKNLLMDLKVMPAVHVSCGKAASIGLNYLYRRQTESVDFDTYGKTDKTYMSLISYGVFTGRVEQYGGEGYANANRSMPWLDERHGVGLQFETRFASPFASNPSSFIHHPSSFIHHPSSISWFHHFAFSHRKGYYGRRSPYTIRLTEHEGDTYTYHTRLQFPAVGGDWGGVLSHLDFTLDAEPLTNWASTYREQTNESGSHFYQYYTPVKTADKLFVDGTVSYTAYILPTAASSSSLWRTQRHALWTFRLAYDWHHRKQTAYVYPYYRRQRLNVTAWSALLSRNLCFRRSVLTLSAEARFSKGSGQPYVDGTFIEPSDKQTPPPMMETWLYREYEYLTAAQRQLSLSVRYAFVLPRTAFPVAVGLSCAHLKAVHPQYRDYLSGTDHTRLRLTVGTTF